MLYFYTKYLVTRCDIHVVVFARDVFSSVFFFFFCCSRPCAAIIAFIFHGVHMMCRANSLRVSLSGSRQTKFSIRFSTDSTHIILWWWHGNGNIIILIYMNLFLYTTYACETFEKYSRQFYRFIFGFFSPFLLNTFLLCLSQSLCRVNNEQTNRRKKKKKKATEKWLWAHCASFTLCFNSVTHHGIRKFVTCTHIVHRSTPHKHFVLRNVSQKMRVMNKLYRA